MSTIKVQNIQHTADSNDAISLASDSSVALKFSGSTKLVTSSAGVTISDTCTATTFSGSGANLTALPAANITGTLPAIDGSNLTGISTALVDDTTPQLGGNLDVQGNELTTTTSNGNIKATPNGSGLFEIRSSGSVDATLQLNCTVNSHGIKLKSPPHSAGQSYTFIFPDNNITADKYLKVKSISGSGATAVGQLEYASLDANDLGEGTIPDARFPATLPAISGANLTNLPAQTDSTKMPLAGGTFTGEVIFQKEITETVYQLTTTASGDTTRDLDPSNGTIQTLTLGINSTVSANNFDTGQSLLLIVTASGSSYTMTWPTMTWVGGSAPTLGGATPTAIELFKVGSTLYGATVGDLG